MTNARALLIAAIGAAIVVCAAWSAKADECVNPDKWHSNIQQGNVGYILTGNLPVTHKELGSLWAVYNDPSRSKKMTDTIPGVLGREAPGTDEGWLIMGRRASTGTPLDTSIIGFFLKGCYVGSLVVPTHQPAPAGDPA